MNLRNDEQNFQSGLVPHDSRDVLHVPPPRTEAAGRPVALVLAGGHRVAAGTPTQCERDAESSLTDGLNKDPRSRW